jgi:hypothetical protein
MTWNSLPTPAARGKLARHLGRLRLSLDAVGEQVREAVANAVGRAMAGAVGEAVYDALLPQDGRPRPQTRPRPGYSGYPSTPYRAWDEPAWERDAGRPDWRDRYGQGDYDDPYDEADPEPEDAPPPHVEPRAERWGRALAAGLQAAAWWLRRHPGRASILAAVSVGVAASLAVLAGHLSGVAGLVMSALGLAYLLDLVRSASCVLGRDDTP